jgi:hypothetical protein
MAQTQEARRREKAEKLVNGSVSTLTLMQREFTIEYLVSGNATEAARTAGYANPDKAGPRLSKEDKIQAVISEFYFGREMEATEVVKRLAQQGRAEYGPFIQDDGSVDLEMLREAGLMHLVKGVRPTQFGLVVEWYDAQAALRDVGRHHGIFKDKMDLGDQPVTVRFVWDGGDADD